MTQINQRENSLSEAVEIIGAIDHEPLVFLCDHASNVIPDDLNSLGLNEAELARHIAWDIGAEAMTRYLVANLGGSGVLARFSRLLIDPNRELWRDDLIPRSVDSTDIPGNQGPTNQGLEDEAKADRLTRFYHPYHAACDKVIEARQAKGQAPLVIGIHSFTPQYGDEVRPWEIGFMWNDDARLGGAMADYFEGLGHVVGRNKPYGGDDLFYTMMRHGRARGLYHTQIEVRQDLLGSQADTDHWAEKIAGFVRGFKGDNNG
jgi:predicted N-formylglutamate amidohydrolase